MYSSKPAQKYKRPLSTQTKKSEDISNQPAVTSLSSRNQPFCCAAAIPSSFHHLTTLLPLTTYHNSLANPLTSAPLIASFLTWTIKLPLSTPLTPFINKLPVRDPELPTFFFILQLLKRLPSPLNIKTTVLTPPPPPPSLSDSLFLGTRDESEGETEKYYVLIERGDQTTISGRSLLLGREWKAISKREAEECLRPAGCGIAIGDGERWEVMDGVERLWCEFHGCWWEVRGLVRMS